MTPRQLWSLVAVVVLLVAAGVAAFLGTHRRETREDVLPPQGEASYNPLYVLGQALRADGLQVRSRPALDLVSMSPSQRDTIVLLQDSSDLLPAQATTLLEWVSGGGHLLLRTPPPGDDGERVEPRLLQQLGVHSLGQGSGCEYFRTDDLPARRMFCHGRRFVVDEPARAHVERYWGRGDHVFARLRHGQGRVDILAELDFLRGGDGGLHDPAHRDLARYLLQPNYGHGTIWLVYGSRPPSLWRQLFYQGWPVWLPLLLALLAWLYTRAQRLGSELPSPVAERRSLLEHVRASGELLLRHRQGPALHAALRRRVLHHLQRRAAVAAALDGHAREQAIADLLGWPPERVALAMSTPSDNDASALGERISLLLQMMRHLR